jgi:hypothetical protein
MRRSTLQAALLPLLFLVSSIPAAAADDAAKAADAVVVTVQVKSGKPIPFTAAALSKLDRVTVKTDSDPPGEPTTYEGVPLASVLHAARITWGTKCSLWLDCYVTVEAADDYRVVFSVPEIDPGLAHQAVLLADRRDGKPLSKSVGPYELIEEGAKQRGRWVKQVTTIRVYMAAE